MSQAPGADRGLLACRSCGHRIARSVRRCPACGLREPTRSSGDSVPGPAPSTARGGGRGWGMAVAVLGAALAGAAITASVFWLRPVSAPAPVEQRAAPPPAPQTEAPPPPPAPEVSRSRGRADWLFFFQTGDHLVRMSDEAPAGMILRTEKRHTFADGTAGPAYLIQRPDGGGQQFVDADELERGTRLR